jgi:hypothetical protein
MTRSRLLPLKMRQRELWYSKQRTIVKWGIESSVNRWAGWDSAIERD